jgi:hypothetical protein
MNPDIQHDMVQARIADMHRQASRINAGRRQTTRPRIRWRAIGLLVAALAFLAGTPAALAIPLPPPGGSTGDPAAAPTALSPAAAGTPGWQIALIAIGSALLASALTLLAVHVTRRATPAQPSRP